MKRLQTLLDVTCPYCGAGFDKKCVRRTTGEPFPEFHKARRQAYRIAKAAEPR